MSKTLIERSIIGLCTVIIGGWLVFWIIQVIGVIELLSLAYGW